MKLTNGVQVMLLGIMNGMVMQRDESNHSSITVKCDFNINYAKYLLENEEFPLAYEKIDDGTYHLYGMPVGGPYSVIINDQKFDEIYVGDLWLLAGQSNMQGQGRYRDYDLTYKGTNDVRAFFMDDNWRKAHHPLHAAWLEGGAIHIEDNFNGVPEGKHIGVGPGLRFAQCMKEKTGVPQGLIASAYGGAGFKYWAPEVAKTNPKMSLYLAMQERLIKNGSHIAGMLWFQGCADAFSCESDKFEERTLNLYNSVRRDFGSFPIIQFQIGRVVHPELPGLTENWMKIREIQKNLGQKTDNLYTITSINKTLDDLIHLSSESAEKIGEEAAELMYDIKSGKAQTPEVQSINFYNDPKSSQISIIEISYKNLKGNLKSEGIPTGFYVSEFEYKIGTDVLFKTEIKGNTVFLKLWGTVEDNENKYLYYGFGLNPYCNLTDSQGNGIMCFGPLKLSNYIGEKSNG